MKTFKDPSLNCWAEFHKKAVKWTVAWDWGRSSKIACNGILNIFLPFCTTYLYKVAMSLLIIKSNINQLWICWRYAVFSVKYSARGLFFMWKPKSITILLACRFVFILNGKTVCLTKNCEINLWFITSKCFICMPICVTIVFTGLCENFSGKKISSSRNQEL